MLAIIFLCLLLPCKEKRISVILKLRNYKHDFIVIEFQLFYSEVKVCARIRTKYNKLERGYFEVFWGEI